MLIFHEAVSFYEENSNDQEGYNLLDVWLLKKVADSQFQWIVDLFLVIHWKLSMTKIIQINNNNRELFKSTIALAVTEIRITPFAIINLSTERCECAEMTSRTIIFIKNDDE